MALANAVVGVDKWYELFYMSAKETNKHGMAGIIYGEWQTKDGAINGTGNYIKSVAASNMAEALHAQQDLLTPGHRGNRYYSALSLTPSHIYGDSFPSAATKINAYVATVNLLKRNSR